MDNWRLVRCGESVLPRGSKTEIVLDCENVVIGRNVDVKYRLDCPNISRQHACMRFSDGKWDIADLRSHNGVFVNGVKISPATRVTVQENDIIGFGKPVAKTEDVFVFKLTNAVVKKEPPDQSTDEPEHKPPFQDVIQLSDDDDVIVTSVICKGKRNIPGASSQHSSVPGPSSLLNGSVAPALKKERDDFHQDSSGPRAFSNQVSSAVVASISPKVEASSVSTVLPRQTPVTGGDTKASNRVSCEAFGAPKSGADFLASSQAQSVFSLQTRITVAASSSGGIAVPPTTSDTRPVEDSSFMGTCKDLPLRAVKKEKLGCNDQTAREIFVRSPKVEVSSVSSALPQRTRVTGRDTKPFSRVSCEASGAPKNGTDFFASSKAQRVFSLQTPMNVAVSSSSGIAGTPTKGKTRPVEDSSFMGTVQDLPLCAVKMEKPACNDQPAGEIPLCSPINVSRPIKQDPEGRVRNEIWSVSNMPEVSSRPRNTLHLENGSRNSPDSTGCASPGSSKSGMHLKSSTSLCQHQEDWGDPASEATFNGEVRPEEREVHQECAGEALRAQDVELCAKPVVVESMSSVRASDTAPKETPSLMVIPETRLQKAFNVAILEHTAESHAAAREHEGENCRSPLRQEHNICEQSSGIVANEAKCISSRKPISPSLFILVKPCSVVVEKLASPEKYIFEGQNEEEDSSEDGDVLLASSSPDMTFSQEDQIITISSDSEDDAAPSEQTFRADLQIKTETENMEETANHGADLDDEIPWENEFLSDLPEERSDCAPPSMNEDRELEKRLVWNEPESEEEGNSAEEGQPENDFFPVLSQSFDDEPVPAKKVRSSAILVEPLSLPSSSVHSGSAHSGNKKSPKKKASLRASLIKSMKKNRVPITDFKNRDVPRDPSFAEETEDRKKSSHKNRFKSRTALLLDTHDVRNIVKKKPCSTPAVSAVHPVSKVGTCNRSNASVDSAEHSAAGETACASHAHSAPGNTFPVQSEPCSSVPSFKKFVRISRVAKPTPVPATSVVSPEQNGLLASSLSVGPRERSPIERMDTEPAPVICGQDTAAWLPEIPSGSPPTIERMELDPAVQGEEVAAISLSWPSLGSGSLPTESMDMDIEERRHVRFHITEPSKRTDQERAQFTERVRASLKKKKLEAAGQKSKANLGAFIAFILGWKVPWLKEQQASSTPPPLLDMDRFRTKRLMYSSLAEYKLVHYQFLCLEVWESVFRSWKEYFALTSRMTFSCAVEGDVCPPGDITILSCVVLVTQDQFQKSLYPVEGHLVRLDLRLKEQRHSAMPVFGFVMQHRFRRDDRVNREAVPPLLQKSYVDGSVPVGLKIQVRTRSQMLDFSKTQRLSVVSKITPTLRQMEAVSDLEQSMFVQTIVRPNTHHFWFRKGHPVRADFLGAFSEEQREVISSAVAAMRAPGNDTRIVMLHGPPGTGKTHTIIGMVTELLRSSSKQTMLIVAPSNTAVDEIARRLLAYRAQQAKHATPPDMMLKAVRVGQDNMMHADVRGISLTELLHKNIQREEAEHCRELGQVVTSLERRMRHLEEKKRRLTSSACPDARDLRRLDWQLGDMQVQLRKAKENKGKRQPRSMNERKLTILRGAHVVLSTLNSCRSRLLEEAFGRTSPCTFSCILVDEATQCTEVEALLCLQYRTSKLILVGDPMQLPATVLSQEAVSHGFQESLFERFYNCLKEEAGLKPIFALREQRRMHSEICQFPSKNFYGGKLRPVAGLDEAYASFPLTPYLVFNIADSPEASEKSSKSWLNCGEAAFVARLCRAIFDIVGVDLSVGVITPYQAQKSAIVEQLSELLSRRPVICDVNTVDSFQGQERDVIVLSCVRAHNPKGHIGFVGDARRLNVAITRAKKALFICGHLDSLKDTKEWHALVSDAKNRGKVRDISAKCSADLLADTIRKPCSFVK